MPSSHADTRHTRHVRSLDKAHVKRHYSALADRDLDDIWDYIAQDSVFQADRLWQRMRDKLEYLAKWQTIGRPRPELSKGCRSYPFGKYCFYFRPSDTGIEVLRILHSARDLDQITFPK